MSDVHIPKETPKPYEQEPWEQDWINEMDGAYKAHRERGLEVLHRIAVGLPLSEREAAMTVHVHTNPNWEAYHELGMTEDVARIMAESIGTFLVNPDAEIGALSKIAALSDERPATNVSTEQPHIEGEQL